MDAHATLPPDRPDQALRQQGDAESGADAAYDGFERAELEMAHADDAATRQQGFEMLTIGAARTQHDDAQVTLPGERLEVGDAGRRQDDQLLAKERFDPEPGWLTGPQRSAVETMLDSLPRSARAWCVRSDRSTAG